MYTYRDLETEEARGWDLGCPRFNFSIKITFLPYKSTLLSLYAPPPDLSAFLFSCMYMLNTNAAH